MYTERYNPEYISLYYRKKNLVVGACCGFLAMGCGAACLNDSMNLCADEQHYVRCSGQAYAITGAVVVYTSHSKASCVGLLKRTGHVVQCSGQTLPLTQGRTQLLITSFTGI